MLGAWHFCAVFWWGVFTVLNSAKIRLLKFYCRGVVAGVCIGVPAT